MSWKEWREEMRQIGEERLFSKGQSKACKGRKTVSRRQCEKTLGDSGREGREREEEEVTVI